VAILLSVLLAQARRLYPDNNEIADCIENLKKLPPGRRPGEKAHKGGIKMKKIRPSCSGEPQFAFAPFAVKYASFVFNFFTAS
jgi:hypothetical protein